LPDPLHRPGPLAGRLQRVVGRISSSPKQSFSSIASLDHVRFQLLPRAPAIAGADRRDGVILTPGHRPTEPLVHEAELALPGQGLHFRPTLQLRKPVWPLSPLRSTIPCGIGKWKKTLLKASHVLSVFPPINQDRIPRRLALNVYSRAASHRCNSHTDVLAIRSPAKSSFGKDNSGLWIQWGDIGPNTPQNLFGKRRRLLKR